MTTFADILGESREVLVKDTLLVRYRPDVLTTGLMGRILEAGASENPLDVLATYRETIPAFLESWDLVNNGEPVPITAEGIDTVPIAILDLVFEAIMADREERRSEEGNGSSASTAAPPPASTTPSSTESRQNGSDSSQPLASTDAVRGSL